MMHEEPGMVRRKATALDDGVRQFLADHPPSCARVNLKLALDELARCMAKRQK